MRLLSSRWRVALIGLPAVFVASHAHALPIDGGKPAMRGGDLSFDVRAWDAACDGAVDDTAALNAAYTALSAAGGGTLVIPAGKTCMVSADIIIRPNVNLRGEPGARIKATAGASFTSAMLTSQASVTDDIRIEEVILDLSGKKGPALLTSGEDIVVRRIVVKNGSSSQASAWNLVRYGCSSTRRPVRSSTCDFSHNRIECAATPGAKDVGLNAVGSLDDGQTINVTNNEIVGCDMNAILVGVASASILVNSVTTIGSAPSISVAGGSRVIGNDVIASGGTCIDLAGVDSTAQNNKCVSSGAYGIELTATGTSAIANRVTYSGTSGAALRTFASFHQVLNNRYSLTAASGSPVGIYAGDGNIGAGYQIISGNIGTVSTSGTQTHLLVAAQQIVATGNIFTGGAYCAVPSQANAAEFGQSINVTFSENRCFSQTVSALITQTGWICQGNYLAWVGAKNSCATAVATVQAGDDRTLKIGTTHLNLTGNLIHNVCAIPGIKVNRIEKTCNGGARRYQECAADNTTQCPGATCPRCCIPGFLSGAQVIGNHFVLDFPGASGSGIDFSAGVAKVTNWTVDGNTFDEATGTAALGIKCPATSQSRVTNITIGVNSYTGMAPATGDTDRGRLDLNCLPSMVQDIYTSYVWLPAARCIAGTPVSSFNLPASGAPSAVCNGTNNPQGFLSYPDGSDTVGYVTLAMEDAAAHQFFAQPVYIVNAANSLSTRWALATSCSSNNEASDPPWSEDTNLDWAYAGSSGVLRYAGPSTIGATVCSNGMFSLRVKRVGSNSSRAQDDQDSPSLLLGVKLWIRRQN